MDNKINKVLLLGSGALKIGEAGEFVEGCLSAEGKEDSLRALLCYDLLDKERRDRQEVNPICAALACLDCRDVWIYQDCLDSFLPHGLEGL